MSVIQPVIPYQAVAKQLQSTSAYLARSKMREILPTSQVTYSVAGSNIIEFVISSADSFADFRNSYMRFDLATVLVNGSTNVATNLDLNRYLSEGGAHCLFRRVTIRSASGALIAEQQNYNLLCAIMSNATQSPEMVASNGAAYGDSMACVSQGTSDSTSAAGQALKAIEGTAIADTTGYVASTGTLTCIGTLFTLGDNVRPGDRIIFTWTVAGTTGTATPDGTVMWGVIKSITSNTVVVVHALYYMDSGLVVPDLTSTTNTGIFAVMSERTFQAVRNYAAAGPHALAAAAKTADGGSAVSSTPATQLCLSPWLDFLTQEQWTPLFLLNGGIRIEFELEPQPARCLVSPNPLSTSFYDPTITITNPRYVVKFIQPSERLRDIYLNMFKTQGFFMIYKSFVYTGYVQSSGGSGVVSNQFATGKRGCNYALGVIQNARHMTRTALTAAFDASTFTTDSLATFLKANLSHYSYDALSIKYPLDSKIVMTGHSNAEALVQLDVALGQYGKAHHRFNAAQWAEHCQDSGNAAESTRLILASLFAKDYSQFSGLDLINTPLQWNFEFDASYTMNGSAADRYINIFVNYDNIANFQQSHGIVIQN